MKIRKEQIGKAVIYIPENLPQEYSREPDNETRQLWEIVQQYEEKDYHRQITERKSWSAMYQLAESRSNIIEWLDIPEHARVLELGAGCGAITSKLLEKCRNVTCQEENINYCRINASRHRESALTIYAMPFAQCTPLFEHAYDWIVLIGVLADTLLTQLSGHLKPGGVLVIAGENKFGLKYWAGNKETHTHAYFAGLENNTRQQGVQLYTGRGLKELLAKTGYTRTQFYYPYPDHRFAQDIYSDKYLPKKGDLSYNIANYEDDRLILFDEQKVFDSIIEEGQFPLFANSYLCMAAKNEEQCKNLQQEIIYTRYASDRARAYALRTDMLRLKDNGYAQKVRKSALYKEGGAHVAHIAEAYERLCKQYEHTDLKFNHCELAVREGKTFAEFEFIHGQALQAQIRELIAGCEIKKVFDILRRMMQYIRSSKNNRPFVKTEEFVSVFGEIPAEMFPGQLVCSGISDIDLILPNILVDGQNEWNVIDYEWTFFFPIPQNYIIYRTLFFLNHENSSRKELAMDKLLAFAGITPQEGELYAQMEAGFQRFVTGGLTPYREMVNLLSRRFWDILQMEEGYDQAMAQNELLKGRGIWKIARKIKRVFKRPDED